MIDKTLLSMVRNIGRLFLLVKEYFDRNILLRKAGLAMRLGTDGGTSAALFEKSAHRLVKSTVKRASLSTVQADPSVTPLFFDALRFDVIVP